MVCKDLAVKYPTLDQSDGAAAQRQAPTFDLRPRALAFARLYAENPSLGGTHCARLAGYSARSSEGAHVRAHELLRDARVIRAVIYFGARALNEARAKAIRALGKLSNTEGRYWNTWDRHAFDRLTATLRDLDSHVARLEKLYGSGVLRSLTGKSDAGGKGGEPPDALSSTAGIEDLLA